VEYFGVEFAHDDLGVRLSQNLIAEYPDLGKSIETRQWDGRKRWSRSASSNSVGQRMLKRSGCRSFSATRCP
jgi:hypothetical protein